MPLPINGSFARRFWPAYPLGLNPVGQHLREGMDRTGWMEIVGVVADVHEADLANDSVSEFYVPTVVHPPQAAYLVVALVASYIPARYAARIDPMRVFSSKERGQFNCPQPFEPG